MAAVIQVKDLVVSYGDRRVVNGLSFEVQKGEIFGFLGPNGSGKSTTIKALLGLVFPKSGHSKIHNLESTHPASRMKIGFMPEEAIHYRFLSPIEILNFYGTFFKIPKKELAGKVDRLLSKVGLYEMRKKPLASFSKGMAQRVSLAQALINDPETLILDEPTTGLDPLAKNELREILLELKKEGKTVFFSSHELSEAEMICDSILIIKRGQAIRQGSMREILHGQKDQSLEQFFLQTIGSAP